MAQTFTFTRETVRTITKALKQMRNEADHNTWCFVGDYSREWDEENCRIRDKADKALKEMSQQK